jgi:hypothetical protein
MLYITSCFCIYVLILSFLSNPTFHRIQRNVSIVRLFTRITGTILRKKPAALYRTQNVAYIQIL